MTNHTPAPWTSSAHTSDHGGWKSPTQQIEIFAGETLIALYDTSYAEYPEDEVNHANARLISAAPDLLAALIRLEAELVEDKYGNEYEPSSFENLAVARAAIAKATQP